MAEHPGNSGPERSLAQLKTLHALAQRLNDLPDVATIGEDAIDNGTGVRAERQKG